MDDSYLKEFDAVVMGVNDGKYVVLDNTGFYPNSGGQPWDEGEIVRESDGQEFKVIFVGKFGGKISHEVDREGLKVNDKVHCKIDWDRRYKLMRSHTSAHIVSGVFSKEAKALITGNQISLDKIRIDFNLENFDRERMEGFLEKANEIVEKNLPVVVSYMSREEAMKEKEGSDLFKLAAVFPENIKEIRIVAIGEQSSPEPSFAKSHKGIGVWDRQADGGTHVKSTGEVGRIKLLKFDNKGAANRRVYYEIE